MNEISANESSDIRREIRFVLNSETIAIETCSPSDTLLDYLRLKKRLTGTKEGCAEGDCGACTVLIGRIVNGVLRYETVNACIRFLPSLDSCHVVTIEHLMRGDKLHPVQEAMVTHHGSQCGFCTPGIVMSLYALWMQNPRPTQSEAKRALQGNLCRCTGYAPIIRAAMAVSCDPERDVLRLERDSIGKRLAQLDDGRRVEGDGFSIPSDEDDLAVILGAVSNATVVAGSSDVGLWVTKQFRDISPAVFIGHLDGLRGIELSDDAMEIGALVSYSDLWPVFEKVLPQAIPYLSRIGGAQIRNMGTVGGNIANGSPIGDLPPLFIALGAIVYLRHEGGVRSLPLEQFFIAYGEQDLRAGEFVEKIHVPLPRADAILAVHKISKRKDEDISALTAVFYIGLEGEKIASARVACGGMAGVPKRATHLEDELIGAAWSEDSLRDAAKALSSDFEPLSDARASAEYRMTVLKNLVVRTYVDATGGVV